ncbi:MAG: hypothetical protein OMM_00809 [Candidatus Magnetoglobus multicellularis str. Araruama]|uniref:ATPase domain protein, prokaryote domain protein n=1 Tax=Candidatus Magnetoglobus multicellularis str. Araruama TaxID=890399 RepID=A0A1V1PG09_9BACT|nr:MAG: hypothetical protein OMM_00809 [Candidatus Magnetoglobus multicellularis str. Araruama]
MKTFHSYGPVIAKKHYFVPRTKLVEECVQSLIGDPDDLGHYFTIWGARQTGKTWLYRQSMDVIKKQYADQFIVGEISMQDIAFNKNDDPTEIFFHNVLTMIEDEFSFEIERLDSWMDWKHIFKKKTAAFDRPLILIIDEFDKLPNEIINNLVSLFRGMYLNSRQYVLHGLALVGVRAVLGVDSKSGSPFNVQRSLHVENLSFDEVQSMFDQYQEESHQQIHPKVIQHLYEQTQGQPGLIGWFGELLTQKYNTSPDQPIDINQWHRVYLSACELEHNNTVRNIISKARNEYKSNVIELFTNANVHFSFNYDWCNYMYMHGLIGYEIVQEYNKFSHVCRFSSPFIQTCLYSALTGDLKQTHQFSILALDPLDTLDDVACGTTLNIKALLERYKEYLKRLKESGHNPWRNQPRRKDFHLTEAVGHFHLYYWLQMALGIQSTISPEFPTGNGKVDLHIEYQEKKGIIEVKSFTNANDAKLARKQAANYAKKTGYPDVTIAMFAPFTDEDVIKQLSVQESIDGIDVTVVVIGQG